MPAAREGPSGQSEIATPWLSSAFVFAAALLLLVLVGVMAFRSTLTLDDVSSRANASYVTLLQLDDVLASITEAETGQRGFLITGKDPYLEPYRRALVNIEGRLQALEKSLGDDPTQQEDLRELRPLIQQRLDEMAEVLSIYQSQGPAEAERRVSTDRGQTLMRAIRSLGASMRQREEDAVKRRGEAADASASRTRALVGIGSALAILLFASAGWIALRHMRRLRRAEITIRQSEQRLNAVVDHSPAVIALRDTATSQYLLVNREWERLYGLPRNGVIGHTPREILPAPIADTIEADDARVFAEGIALQFEEIVPTPQGDRVFLVSRFPLLDEDRGSIFALGRVSTDITARKRTEDELRRAMAEIHDLYNRSPCGYHSISGNGTFIQMNDTELSWLGYSRDEVIEHLNIEKVFTRASIYRFRENFPVFKERGWIRGVEFEMVRKDGTTFPVLLNATAIYDADGNYLQSRSTVFDITDRKAMEEALRRASDELEVRVEERTAELASANEELSQTAAKLERSNRELQDFAYVASHDLQEPLRKIRTFADRLRSKWAPSLPEDAVDYLERMVRSAERMQRLINDLLALSRVTTQGQPFVTVDLMQLAREVVSDLEVRIEQSGAQVEIEDLPSIEADPTQMRQLLQNLIGNALKFHRGDRTPRVRVTATVDANGDRCEIRVEDNGIGFDVKYVDRIFNPFQRLHGRDEYEGTGMGLAICRKIAERHRGTITARSTPGEGAAFIVRLPRRREVEAA